MSEHHHSFRPSSTPGGSAVPSFLYGTAEKQDPFLIFSAINAGYRGLDCACQPQYYHEEVVGQAIALASLPVSHGGLGLDRSELFIQTKFTTPAGHKPELAPYCHEDSPETKVQKSLEMSLSKLGVDYVDVLLLHGPMPTMQQTLDIWLGMEALVGSKVRNLGLSNVSLEQLETVFNFATTKPSVVQNRFWHRNDFDCDVRRFCTEQAIVYQAFWVLTGNPRLLDSNLVGWFAEKIGASREDALFTLVLSLGRNGSGISVLNGTTNPARMVRSLKVIETVGLVPEIIKRGFEDELNALSEQLNAK